MTTSFELTIEPVHGRPMTVFRDRHRSLRELLDASAEFGEREYLVDGDRRISYADHHAAVGRVAHLLASQGVGAGDRVAILGRNSIEWVVTFWATVSVGAVAVGLNAWWSREELDFAIAAREPKVLVDDMSLIRDAIEAHQSPHSGHRSPLSGDWRGVPDVEVHEDDPAV